MSAALPWDDETVVMVNCVSKATETTGENKITTLPNISDSLTQLHKNSLHPIENMASNRSPSLSPKMRKRHLHNSLPQKPGAIDNSQLIIQNSCKVSNETKILIKCSLKMLASDG